MQLLWNTTSQLVLLLSTGISNMEEGSPAMAIDPIDPAQYQNADATNLDKIKLLLKARDDTQRFVGLALLKTVLDNSPDLRQDEEVIRSLWASISSKFLDRLLKTGSTPSNKNAKDMLDLSVSVLHTFAVLLPQPSREEPKFTGRIPLLVASALHRYATPSSSGGRITRQLTVQQLFGNPGAASSATSHSSELAPWCGNVCPGR